MRVRIPSPLRSYTGEQAAVEADGRHGRRGAATTSTGSSPACASGSSTSRAGSAPHMKVFVDQESVRDLTTPVTDADEVTLMQALSGG